MAKKRVMITVDEDLLERMEAACKSQGVSKSAYISTLVSRDIDDSKKFLNDFKTLLEQAMKDGGMTS